MLLLLGGLALLFGVAWYYAKIAFGEERIPNWTGMPGTYYRDALVIGLSGSATLIGLSVLLQTAAQHWPTVHRYMDASFGASFDAWLPAASILGVSLQHSLTFAGVIALLASFVLSQIRRVGMRLLLFALGAVALVGSDWGNSADFLQQLLVRAIILGVIVLGVSRVARFNVLGYFLVLISTALVGAAGELLKQPERFYRLNGYALLGALGMLLVWPLVVWRLRPSPAQG